MHTLLLADDSVTIQRVIELTFAEEDVQVVAVSDGDQAIQRLESAPPDIVLADIGMPGRDGYEVARYMRQTPKLAHIPVVLLTGAFEPVDQVKAAEVQCDGVLAKPFEPQLVIGRVKELLATRHRGAAVVPPPVAAPRQPEPLTPPPAVPAAPQKAADLDEYFDRLDTAFATLTGNPPPPASANAPVVPEPPASLADEIDAYAAGNAPQPSADPELPLSYASPAPEVVRAIVPPVEPPAKFEAPAPPPPSLAEPPPLTLPRLTRELPTVAEAFATILAAEQHDAGASSRPVWPTASAAAPAPPVDVPAVAPTPEVTEEMIEQIVQRVLSRLSVRDTVAQIAERLIREEIERIKSQIK